MGGGVCGELGWWFGEYMKILGGGGTVYGIRKCPFGNVSNVGSNSCFLDLHLRLLIQEPKACQVIYLLLNIMYCAEKFLNCLFQCFV